MLTKVYVAQNAFEQALAILNLFYLQMREENTCLSHSELVFLAVGNKINFRITWHCESISSNLYFSL
jgi:hypothetical protein